MCSTFIIIDLFLTSKIYILLVRYYNNNYFHFHIYFYFFLFLDVHNFTFFVGRKPCKMIIINFAKSKLRSSVLRKTFLFFYINRNDMVPWLDLYFMKKHNLLESNYYKKRTTAKKSKKWTVNYLTKCFF